MDLINNNYTDININWYNCGPTIYNRSHLGHARTFMVFDTMVKYYKSIGLKINYCMNITDIDDKIVKKLIHNKILYHINDIINNNELKAIAESWPANFHPEKFNDIINDYKNTDMLTSWILKQKIKIITKEDITPSFDDYCKFIEEMEKYFWLDMEKIGVGKPDILVRVSDNIKHIINFIEQIINNGYAYISNGSVYLDSEKYIGNGFDFNILNNSDNAFHKVDFIDEKKDPKDFALWKASKSIDISFDSPWGKGRPGWHIECSAMIHQAFNNDIMVHSGGIDLSFPHHNNEMIQTIAFNNAPIGIPKLFFHSGHLLVNNDKMSQSLQNFTTIDLFLKNNSPRVLRLLFMMHKWNKQLDFSSDSIEYANNLDKKFNEFIKHIDYLKRKSNAINIINDNIVINNIIINYDNMIQHALCDKFDTETALKLVEELIKIIYIRAQDGDIEFAISGHSVVNKLFNILGIDYNVVYDNNIDDYINAIIDIRNKIRLLAINSSDKNTKKDLFELSDWIRNDTMKSLNIVIEDLGFNKDTKWNKI